MYAIMFLARNGEATADIDQYRHSKEKGEHGIEEMEKHPSSPGEHTLIRTKVQASGGSQATGEAVSVSRARPDNAPSWGHDNRMCDQTRVPR